MFPPGFRRGGRRGDPFTVARLRPGDRLVLGCGCGAATTLGRGDLIRLLGAAAPLDLIGLRLRCARCGGPPSGGRFEWGPGWNEGGRGAPAGRRGAGAPALLARGSAPLPAPVGARPGRRKPTPAVRARPRAVWAS